MSEATTTTEPDKPVVLNAQAIAVYGETLPEALRRAADTVEAMHRDMNLPVVSAVTVQDLGCEPLERGWQVHVIAESTGYDLGELDIDRLNETSDLIDAGEDMVVVRGGRDDG